MTNQLNGTIKYFNPQKGFGFIKPSETGRPDIFFFVGQLRGNAARIPQRGESVVYEEGIGKRGPIATVVYNMADSLAREDHQRDCETAKKLDEHWQAAHVARKAFTAELIERNRQWHLARQNR